MAGDGAAEVSGGIPGAEIGLGEEGGGGEAAPHRNEVGPRQSAIIHSFKSAILRPEVYSEGQACSTLRHCWAV